MTSQNVVDIDQITNAVLVIDQHGFIAKANADAERLFGYEPGKLAGLGFNTLHFEKYRKPPEQSFDALFPNPAVHRMSRGLELYGVTRDCREIPIEISLGALADTGFSVAVARDTSATKRTPAEGHHRERALAQSIDQDRLHQLVLSSMSESLAVLDSKGKITAVNSAWTAFAHENGQDSTANLGVGADYLAVCKRAARTDPVAKRALAGIRSVLDGSLDNFRLEYPCHSPTIERYFSMSATAMKNAQGAIIVHTNLTELVRTLREVEHALSALMELKDRSQAENEYFQDAIKSTHDFEDIIGNSEAIRRTLKRVELVASTDSTVLLLGETGTGKELLAHAIHARSERRSRPLIKVDCCTLPSGLIESELFGHEKGAFTGAYQSKIGRFELADDGTIFLDEIGELPIDLQSKLLRMLDTGEFERLGSQQVRTANVRIIAATNRNLSKAIREGTFRADLYYRLSTFPIDIPPLRERREDIAPLVSFFVTRLAAEGGKTIRSISKASLRALETYDWPGNVRELRNVIERSVILCQTETLELSESLGEFESQTPGSMGPLKQDLQAVERARILRALDASQWKIKGDGNAASRLGLAPSTLRSKMKMLDITRP